MEALHNPNHDHSFNLYCPKRSPWSRGFSIKQSIRGNLPQLRTHATYKHMYSVFEEANASPNLPQQGRTLVDKIKLYGSNPPYPAERITPVLPPNPNQREREREKEIYSTPLQPLPELALPIPKLKNRSTYESPESCPLLPRRRPALSSSSRPQHSKAPDTAPRSAREQPSVHAPSARMKHGNQNGKAREAVT